MAYAGSCETCKHCSGNVRDSSGKCEVVFEPVTGRALPIAYARMDRWNGYTLPCKYEGHLWEAKDDAPGAP